MNWKILLISVLAIFAPIKAALLTAMGLSLIDCVSGVMAAKKRGEPITSMGLRRTVSKIIIFQSAILLAFITERYMMGDLLPLAKIVAAYIGMVEYKSILENLNDINGGSIFKVLIDKLSKKEEDKL